MELDPLEIAVLQKMLDGEQPVLRALRRQLEGLSVVKRERTGAGVFTFLSPSPGSIPARFRTNSLRIGDVHATIPGLVNGAGFVLYVENGLLKMLEAYSYEESWPAQIESFQLRYEPPDRSSLLAQLSSS
jgi:hypothetical protein